MALSPRGVEATLSPVAKSLPLARLEAARAESNFPLLDFISREFSSHSGRRPFGALQHTRTRNDTLVKCLEVYVRGGIYFVLFFAVVAAWDSEMLK